METLMGTEDEDKNRSREELINELRELRRIAEESRKSEKRLRALVDNALVGTTVSTAKGKILYMNNYGLRMMGFESLEEARAEGVLGPYRHPEDRETLFNLLRQTGRVANFEEELRKKTGEPLFILNNAVLEDGVMTTIMIDITDRKLAEIKIRELKDRLQAENLYLRDEIELQQSCSDIIGASDVILSTIRMANQAAGTKTTVLVTGETGTGKGIFARHIHKMSDRSDRPFVNVNCASLPANLIESELFGREKGAFTGSSARQIGRFELANTGTVFLDEIGELLPELQAKLLKVIEEGEFERLGSPRPVKVDVRIIASTNRDLREEIKKGRFRQDLYYRLNVFPVEIPPLRKRRGDISLLAKAYAAKFSQKYNKVLYRFPTKLMESLESYTWPGNVRELINVVERAVIVSNGPELRLAENMGAAPSIETSPILDVVEQEDPCYARYRAAREKRARIMSALRKTGWRVEGPRGAAKLLGVNPSTLRTRMKKFGITRPGSHEELIGCEK
jgi:PAS domain S-box-containing protein